MNVSLARLLDVVRTASAEGRLVAVPDVWAGTVDELREALASSTARGDADAGVTLIVRSERAYLYSEDRMTGAYAAAAALALDADACRTIAEVVRRDSATYPRPTPLDIFSAPPFSLSLEAIQAALDGLAADARYADVQLVQASDGTRFLFSARHLVAAHARSLAEWLAVGQFENQ